MPFRFLGVVARLEDIDTLYGQLLESYAESGTQVTLACVDAVDQGSVPRQLALPRVIVLDPPRVPRDEAGLEETLLGVIVRIRPHVVVADSNSSPVWMALAAAASRARSASGGGTAALPAKVYYRVSVSTPAVAVTTAVRVSGASSRAVFVRAFPYPWVTGVLENDLFSGLVRERDDARQLLAAS